MPVHAESQTRPSERQRVATSEPVVLHHGREGGGGAGDELRASFNGVLGGLAPHIRMCDNSHMATNLAIDDRLLEEARRIGGQKTKRATVTEALSEYIQRRKQQQIIELFGKLDVDPTYDYKKQRRRK
jgi:Bacterial antitoxin of type II TA system, VapB